MPGFPIATRRQVTRVTRSLMRRHRRLLTVVTAQFLLAAGGGLAGPWLLGRMVDDAVAGASASQLGRLATAMVGFLVAEATLSFFAHRNAMVLGERVFAELREGFVGAVTNLPLSEVEAAGTGDLLTRTTRDVDEVSRVVRYGVPEILVSIVTILATVVACVVLAPLLAFSVLAGVPLLAIAARWYLHRSTPAYRAVSDAYSTLFDTVAANVESGRTVDALRLGGIRRRAVDAGIRGAYTTSRYTLWLRTILYPATNFAFALPVMVALLWGGWLTSRDLTTAGATAAVCLYVMRLASPVEDLIQWFDQLQSSAVSLARMVGVHHVPPDRVPTDARPSNTTIELADVTFEYQQGHPVLRDISLSLIPGERIAVVGPSGSGKSTLARIIAGIQPPLSGSATIGGVPLVGLELEDLRRDVALVTQEHHVFHGTIAENVGLGRDGATDDQILAALAAVGAERWVQHLSSGLQTPVGSGELQLTAAQAQEVALARLVLLDPHTVVLDEATAMLDPSAARSVERSMAAVMTGRTVVAIAHRLHTAQNSDRIAVVLDGRIAELGTHDVLIAKGDEYARLWRAWQDPGT